MAEIRFKATRRKHSSGFSELEKSGAMEYDQDSHSTDGIWLYPKGNLNRIFIDHDPKTREFILHFSEEDFNKSILTN